MKMKKIAKLILKINNRETKGSYEPISGYSLHLNPQGNRSKDVEQSIEHYNQALEVYTYQAFQ
jgi:hypothetical protein